MPFRQITATTTAAQIAPQIKKRLTITVRSLGAAQVFISHDQVNILTQGFPLSTGEYLSLIERDGDDPAAALYARTGAGTADLRIEESYERVVTE